MKDGRRKKSSAHWDSNPTPFDHETMLLPNQLKVFLKNASHRKSEHFLKEAFFIIAVKLQKVAIICRGTVQSCVNNDVAEE